MADLNLNELERLAREATPQDFDSAKLTCDANGWIECPHCGGEGNVQLEADYCNYDGQALGVQFYGIGNEFGTAERYYRAARPAVILAMIARIRELELRAGQRADGEGRGWFDVVREKLQRFEECADDGEDCDIGRDWFDALTLLGLLRLTQHRPAEWTMTEAGELLLS